MTWYEKAIQLNTRKRRASALLFFCAKFMFLTDLYRQFRHLRQKTKRSSLCCHHFLAKICHLQHEKSKIFFQNMIAKPLGEDCFATAHLNMSMQEGNLPLLPLPKMRKVLFCQKRQFLPCPFQMLFHAQCVSVLLCQFYTAL